MTRAVILLLFLVPILTACAANNKRGGAVIALKKLEITSIKPSNTILYGATATVTIKATFAAKAKKRYTMQTQLWEDDGPFGDEHLVKSKKLGVKRGSATGTLVVKVTCTKTNGYLKGDKETDKDDGDKVYEIYAYAPNRAASSANEVLKCVLPDDEDDDDDDEKSDKSK